MLNTSPNFSQAVLQPSRDVDFKVLIGNTVLTTEEIMSCDVEYTIGTGQVPAIGGVVASKLNLKLIRHGNTPSYFTNQTIKPYAAIAGEWVPLGVFYANIDNIKRTDLSIEVECFDAFSKFESVEYKSDLAFPKTIDYVLDEMNLKYGTTFINTNLYPKATIKSKPEGLSIRAVISEIAELMTSNAIVDREGNMIFAVYDDFGFRMTDENYIDFSLEGDTDAKITKLICQSTEQDADGNQLPDLEVGTDGGASITFQNASVTTKAELQTIYDRMFPLTYTAYTLKSQGMPHIETGDIITLVDKKGVTHKLYVTTHNLSFNGGLISTFSAKAPQMAQSVGSNGSNSISQSIANVNVWRLEVEHIFAGNITADHIQSNAITADKINAGAITADKIHANAVTADKIAANSIKTDHLQANSVNADKIAANSVSADKITANAITTEKINAGAITTEKITAGAINTDKLAANSITTGKIAAGQVTADKIATGAISADKIEAGAITAGKIDANAITVDLMKANVIEAVNASIGKIDAEHIDVSSITVDNIDAGKITTGDLHADRMKANAINAVNLGAGTINANKISTEGLVVGTANISNGAILTAKIGDAQITTAKIANLAVDNAKIKDLNASKITAGTIDTGRVSVGSVAGNLSIANNTISIRDNQSTPKTRVQVGLDSRGKYGILVFNAAGQAIFDSDYGVLSDKGLSDGVVSNDKIVDGTIQPNKIVLDQLFATEAYVDAFNAQTINASMITTGKIKSDLLDIEGLVSFSALDPELSKNFIFDGSKTWINGGELYTGSVKADSIDVKGLRVEGPDKLPTFEVSDKGEVIIDGLLHSANFSETTGYQITTDGKAILNQAVVRGDVILPNAGITDFGAQVGGENLLLNTNFAKTTTNSGTTSKNPNLYPSSWGGYNGGIANPTTNYHAHIDADTFGYNVVEYNESDGTRHWKGISQGFTAENRAKLSGSKKYTISFDIYPTIENPRIYGGFYHYLTGGTTQGFHGGQFSKSSGYIPNQWQRISLNVPISATIDLTQGVSFYIYGYGFGQNGIAYIKNVKLEEGSVATPWCLAMSEQLDTYTRIWAGANYDNRDNAPFRVLQNGDIYATRGTFGGTVASDQINSGLVHIHNNEIIINRTATRMDEQGRIYNIEPLDTEQIPYIKLSQLGSNINTNLTLGSEATPNIIYNNGANTIDLKGTSLSMNNGARGSMEINTVDSSSQYQIFASQNTNGGQHRFRYNTGEPGLIMESQGGNTTSSTPWDFLMKRADGADVQMWVQGDLKVNKNISSNQHQIQMRSQSDGFYFYSE